MLLLSSHATTPSVARNDYIYLCYSKEISGDRRHEGIHWKQYKEIGKILEWEADVDITGKIMDKGGNTVRRVIRLKDLSFKHVTK